MATRVPGDDSPQTTRSNEELLDKIQQWNLDNSEREVVIVVGGKSGTGKSTLVNNFLTLDGKEAAEARIQPTSVTDNVKVYKGEMNGVLVRAVDMPGLHAHRHNRDKEKDVIATLSHHTEGKADILIYCVSLTQRLDSIDERNIATLNKAFGKKLWANTILVLTHADTVLEDDDNADKLDEIVEGFTKELEEILTDCAGIKACVRPFSSCHTSESSNPDPSPTTEVAPDLSPESETEAVPGPSVATEQERDETTTAPESVASESRPEESSGPVEIIAIPIGKKPNKPPGWRDALLAQVITICLNKSMSYLTKLEGMSWEEIVKKLKKGAKVGATAGVIGGASGAAIGTGIGAAVGGVIGGILTAPFGGFGAAPTAAGGAAVGALLGSLFGGGGAGVVALLTGGLATAHNESLFKEIAFYFEVRKKLEELQKKRQNEPSD